MLLATDPQGQEKDYIAVPADWNYAGLGRNLGFQWISMLTDISASQTENQIDRSIKHEKTN